MSTIGLSKYEFSIFAQDAMFGSVAVGGACPVGCIFCCLIGQSAIGRKNWTNYISEEDLINVLPFINVLVPEKKHMFLGEGPTFLSCEPFKHPNYINLLKLIHKHKPHLIKFTSTIGKFVEEKDFELIKTLNTRFIVSVNSLDLDMRKRMMGSDDEYDNLIKFLTECESIIDKISLIYGGDLKVLENDVKKLHSINPGYKTKAIKIALPEYSQYHSSAAKDLFDGAYATWLDALKLIYSLHENLDPHVRNLSYFPRNTLLAEYEQQFDDKMIRVLNAAKRNNISTDDIGFILAESVWEYANIQYPKLSSNFIFTKNITFGGSYVVSSLLSKNDILEVINKNKKFHTYALPDNIFNPFKKDIAGNSFDSYGLKSVIFA